MLQKTKSIITIILSILLSIFVSTSQAFAKPQMQLSQNNLKLYVNDQYDINIKNKIAGSKFLWTSSNTDVAIVNKNNGIVKAVGVGEAVIKCEITLPNQSKQLLQCDVVTIDKPKFFQNRLMAHALGGYEGNIYNNTEEALLNSIKNGYHFIEVDITLTADNKLVCSHGWDKATCEATGVKYTGKAPTYNEFMNWKIQGKYNTIDAKTVIEYMRKYPNLLIEIDLKKFNAKKTKIMIEQLVDLCNNDATILDRILMQFTSEEAFYAIEEVYHFKYYQYFTYKSNIKDNLNHVIDFCKKNNITSIAVNHTVLTDSMIDFIKSNNFYLLAFTIDDPKLASKFLDKGVDTICTNFITYENLKFGF